MIKPKINSRKFVYPVLALILVVLACGPVTLAEEILSEIDTWYVATDGDDSNSCLSPEEPCLTLNETIHKSGSLDQIIVAAGVYNETPTRLTSYFYGLYITKSISITGAGYADTSIVITPEQTYAMFIAGDIFVTISGVSISNANESGIYVSTEATLTLEDSRVHSNGRMGIYVFGGTATLNNVLIESNGSLRPLDRVPTESVSGVKNHAGNVTIRDSSISRNRNGGGVLNQGGGTLRLFRTTISTNQGAGVWNFLGSASIDSSFIHNNWFVGVPIYAAGIINNDEMTVNNSTVSGNQGSGIIGYNEREGPDVNLTISYTTIANNRLRQLSLSGSPNVTLANVLFASATVDAACGVSAFAVVVTSGNNISTDSSCLGALDVEPDLLSLALPADNGGPTFTMALGSGSPAIDGAIGNCPATDQRGITRPYPVGFLCDVGAYEFDPLATADTISLESSEVPDFATVTPSAIDESDDPDQPTVIVDTLCWVGPGPPFDAVSSLQAGTVVELLGIGEEDGWLIIGNPVYLEFACWVDEEDVDLDPDFDLSVFATIPVPFLPTSTPTTSPTSTPTPTTAPVTPPSAPSNLSSSTLCVSPNYHITLNWFDNSNNETGFRIYRDGNLIATVGAGIMTYIDTNPTDSNGHNYTVRAYNNAGESSPAAISGDGCIF